MASVSGRVIIYGGKGALGSTCVSFFKSQNWWVGCIDMCENEDAHGNVLVKSKEWAEQEADVLHEVENLLNGEKVDAVICVAGGWAGGNVASKDLIKSCDMMWKQSVWPSIITASLSAKYLKEGGLVSFTGAKAALEGTPGMVGYGIAKAAVHQFVKSLALPNSGLPSNSLALAILPVTLDTPMNRKFMPKADFSSWTPLQFVAKLLFKWALGTDCPKNGSLVQLVTKSGETELVID